MSYAYAILSDAGCPARGSMAGKARHDMSNVTKPLEGLSILIAEDSWQLADAMRKTVELAGAKVVGMAGTLETIEALADSTFYDALILDLNLHGERANALAERLASSGRKVVVLTGYERPAETGVHEWLTKPVATEAIIAALARPLGQTDEATS